MRNAYHETDSIFDSCFSERAFGIFVHWFSDPASNQHVSYEEDEMDNGIL
jgi:hypothetical protein